MDVQKFRTQKFRVPQMSLCMALTGLLHHSHLCHYCECLRNCCDANHSNHHLLHILHFQDAALQKQILIYRLLKEHWMSDSPWKSNLEVSHVDQVAGIVGCEKLAASHAGSQPTLPLLSDLVVQSNQTEKRKNKKEKGWILTYLQWLHNPIILAISSI